MQQAFWIFPMVYMGALLAVTALVLVVLWRIMKAQETTAHALLQIAQAISRLSPPAKQSLAVEAQRRRRSSSWRRCMLGAPESGSLGSFHLLESD